MKPALLSLRPWLLAAVLFAALLTAGLAALLPGSSELALAQGDEPPPVANLRCLAETDRVAFLWDAPEWSGGEAASYDYRLSLPDGRQEGGRLQGKGSTVLYRPGSYPSGQAASVSVTANYATPGGEAAGAEAELTCYIGGAPATPTPTPTPAPAPTATPTPTPNQAPTVSAAIADRTIVHESGTQSVSLSGVFDDGDGDSLTVAAGSSDDAVATVSVASDYSSLTVSAQSRGTATITVTADDGNGGTVSDSFTVRVKAAPVVAQALADVSALAEGATREVSLAGVFRDADDDSLTVTAASSKDAVVRVSAALGGSKLTVAGVDAGTATITVTAEDTDGNRVSDAFDATVAALQQQQQARSSDATLSGLVLLRDGSAIPLRPAFSPQTAEYGATVPLGNSWATLRPTASHAGATITVAGKTVRSGANSERFFLHINTPLRVEVVVTAEDGETQRTYAVTATHAPSARLRGLSLSAGQLHPLFSGFQSGYRAWVPHSVDKVTVTPTNADPEGTITVNGQTVASGAASPAIALDEGENAIAVKITAPDDYTSRSYTITVTRASAQASADATLRGLAVHTASSNQPDAANNVPYSGAAYQLTPAFKAGVYDYRVNRAGAFVGPVLRDGAAHHHGRRGPGPSWCGARRASRKPGSPRATSCPGSPAAPGGPSPATA